MKHTTRLAALLLALALLLSTLPAAASAETQSRAATVPFTDVPITSWYCASVSYAYLRDLVSGVSATEFAPMRNITRAQFVTILSKILMPAGYAPTEQTPNFSDLADGAYYVKAVRWAAENGIVGGTGEGIFSPNAPIKRQDMATMLYKSEQLEAVRELPLTNEPVVFKDDAQIADYAKDAVAALQRQGFLAGDNEGNVNPRKKLTRAEAAAVLSSFHAALSGHRHNYVMNGKVPATCTVAGYDSYICTCGAYYGVKFADALGHVYVETAFNSQTWQHTYRCSRCGEIYQTPLPKPLYSGDSLLEYKDMKSYIAQLAEMYPDIISVSSAGKSVKGLDLTLVKLGRGSRYIFMNGNIHAREYITTNYLIDVIDEYAYAYVTGGSIGGFDIRSLLNQYTLVILPCSNPDGRAIAIGGKAYYKGNANGVDLNRNFPIYWKSYDDDGAYGGKAAASEPETKAILSILRQYDFDLILDCHTAGNVIYYTDAGCTEEFSAKSRALADELARFSNYQPLTSTTGAGLGNYGRNKGEGVITFTIEMWPTLTHPIDCSKYYSYVWNRISSMPAVAMRYLLTENRAVLAAGETPEALSYED